MEGVSIWWSVNCTDPSLNLIQRNVPQNNISAMRLSWQNNFTSEDSLRRFWLTGETPGKPLENTHTSSSWRVPSRLFRSRSAGFLFELRSGSSLQRCFALCERTTVENWRTTAAVLMWCYLQLIGLDLDWKLCRNSAFSHHETGSWIWVSRFQFWHMYLFSPNLLVYMSTKCH